MADFVIRGSLAGQAETITCGSIDNHDFPNCQAFVKSNSYEEGTPILILARAPKDTVKAPVYLNTGYRFILPELMVILSRTPKFTRP